MNKNTVRRSAPPKIVFDAKPEWEKLYTLAWNLALENVDPVVRRPGWLPQMTCMPGVGIIWQWDSCFMAMYARYLNGAVSPMNNLDNLYALQRDDGYISMAYRIEEGVPAYGERINPPLYAWAEWEYYRFTSDIARVERVYPVLLRYHEWIEANRRRRCGLYYFEDTGSSGMDNSPRSGYPAKSLDGSDVCFVDLACQQVLAARCLARLADAIGRTEDAARLRANAEATAELVNLRHYKERTRFYHDCFTDTMNAVGCKTVAGFWPLIAEIADVRQACALIEHLNNPAEFRTEHPVPSLSADDPNYDPAGGYWLGGVWAPTNYMIVKGLERYGAHDFARELAARHLEAMAGVMNDPAYGSIWECYAPEGTRPATRARTDSGPGVPVRDRFVGWSALGPVSMLIETVMGLDFDGVSGVVTWRIANARRHGIFGLDFAGGRVSLLCQGRGAPGKTQIEVESTVPFTLRVIPDGRSGSAVASIPVAPGTSRHRV